MKTKAVRIHGVDDLRLEEFELPKIKDDEILAKVISDSICMSSHKLAMQGDRHKRVRAPLATAPTIIGHEFCGELVEVGKKWKGQFKPGAEVRHPARPQLQGHPLGARLFLPAHRRRRDLRRDPGRGHGARLPPRLQGRRLLHGLPLRARVLHRRRLPRAVPHEGRLLRPRDGHQGRRLPRPPRERRAHGHRRHRLRDARATASPRAWSSPTSTTPGSCARPRSSPSEEAKRNGVELHYVNTKDIADPVAHLKSLNGGKLFDDVFVFAPVKPVVEMGDRLLGRRRLPQFLRRPHGHLLLGPAQLLRRALRVPPPRRDFGRQHRRHQGVPRDDGRRRLNPVAMITHVGGLTRCPRRPSLSTRSPGARSSSTRTRGSTSSPSPTSRRGERPSPSTPSSRGSSRRNNMLWSKEAEDYLLPGRRRSAAPHLHDPLSRTPLRRVVA